MNLSREEVGVILIIVSICLNIYQIIDQSYLAKERLFQNLVKKTNKHKKCVLCDRPMIITKVENE